MKNIIKIISIIVILAILLQNTISVASVVSLGETTYIERAERGFYSIEHWSESKQMWQYVTYSRTYYTDDNGTKRLAYCMSPDKLGIGWISGEYDGYDTIIKEKLSDVKLWRVLKNGYPYVTLSELGVDYEDDGYLATKQAAYCIIKNMDADEVYDYYRVGTFPINGEDMDEIEERGQKVLDAIYKLVDIGNNGSEQMNGIKIKKVGDMKRDSNKSDYSSQEYVIENNNKDIEIKITEMHNEPKGSYIADVDGKSKNAFAGGEHFKIMVPTYTIKKDFTIRLDYESTCKNYPVYVAESTIDNTQDYILTIDKYEDEKGKINCEINSHISTFEIIKKDEDTNEPIANVEFNVKYEDGEEIGNFITDEDGKIILENLRPGKIVITEISADEAYIINETSSVHTIEFDTRSEVTIYNKARRGSLEIIKVDKDNNEVPLEGVEFSLIDKEGRTIETKTTDENGKITFDNIKIGEYILRENTTLDEYNLKEDQTVIIKENETTTITVENEKKKGQIEVIKVDKDNNNIKIPNVEFEVTDKDGSHIESIKTDQNGCAKTSMLPIGEYYIQEVKTGNNYILDDTIHQVIVNENEVSEIKIENQKKKGRIKIYKISKEDNNITHQEAGEPLSDVKFAIYNEEGELIEYLITDEEGYAISGELDVGKYIIQEIEAAKYYKISDEKYEIEITDNEETVEITIENDPSKPEIVVEKDGPEKAKSGEEIRYDFNIKNSGNTDVNDFTWFDFLPYEKARITKFSTGTYNQETLYNVYYKTNKYNEYILLRENLNSKVNNYIDISAINLADDEKITEIKICFGNVKEGFKSEESPYMILKLNQDLADNTEVINETILEGHYEEYKLTSEDSVTTIIINEEPDPKRLPRTGY